MQGNSFEPSDDGQTLHISAARIVDTTAPYELVSRMRASFWVLAPLVAREIWAILRQLRDAGMSSIIVDKNFPAVSSISDRNIVLVKGRVILEGSAADLKRDAEALQRHLGI